MPERRIRPNRRQPTELSVGTEASTDQNPDCQLLVRWPGVAGGQDLLDLAGVVKGRLLEGYPRPAQLQGPASTG